MAIDSSKLCVLVEGLPPAVGTYNNYLLESTLMESGFTPSKVRIENTSGALTEKLNSHDYDLIITMGEGPLRALTGKKGVDKWSLSPLESLSPFRCKKVLPTFDFLRLQRQYEYRMFFFQTFAKASRSMYEGPWKRKRTNYRICTTFAEVEYAQELLQGQDRLAVDIETSRGTINTIGFAWSSSDAVAIRCEPGYYDDSLQWRLWSWATDILENGSIKKILQNNVYEGTYFARYGIQMRGVWHDTMWAQKLLYPEFKQGLNIVGQLFTDEIYWKEDGKDWSNINNWAEHLLYNCKDTSNTFEAALRQRDELKARNLLSYYDDYFIRLAEPLNLACCQGLPVDEPLLKETHARLEKEIEEQVAKLPPKLNYRSPKQKVSFFEEKGYKIPKKRNGAKWSKSVDELSLRKLRAKHPEDKDIDTFLTLAKLEKFFTSYVNFTYHDDSIMRYTLKGSGTETLRFSGGTDSWGLGMNPQTIPSKAKRFFKAPEGHVFLQVDLAQAESRYVAYKAREMNLIEMLEDPKQDVHSFVASNAFGVPIEQVIKEKQEGNPAKRQLGKKSGHGANYAMSAHTFMEQCFKEGLEISKAEAERILSTYHRLFPGIKRWHNEIRKQLYDKGWLENPLGFRRYFWGRKDDNTFREAYAFEPQSTIPAITNHLLLYALDKRTEGAFDFNFHLQVHDSLVFSVKERYLKSLAELCKDTSLWHPEIVFPAGKLVIPTDVEYGPNLKDLKEYEGS